MKNNSIQLYQCLSKYLPHHKELSPELERALSENVLIKEIPKGTILLKEGEICNECYFILHGLMRTYYIREYEEVTTDFFWEEQVVSPTCYGKNIPSEHFVECLEDTIAFIGSPNVEQEMFKRYPELETMSRLIGEKIMASYKDNFDIFKMLSPEQRYLHLVENRPELIQRAPQYQIASYLGIKPESLSRIRKRICNR